MNGKKSLLPIDANGKQSVIVFLATLILIIGITFILWAIKLANSYAVRLCLSLLINVTYAAVAVVALFLTGQKHVLVPTKKKLWL